MKPASQEQQVYLFLARLAERYTTQTHPGRRPRPQHNGYLRVWTYLSTLAYRVFNDRHLAGHEQPSETTLADAISQYVETYLSKFIRSFDPTTRPTGFERFAYIGEEQLAYLSQTLAGALLRDWTPERIDEWRRRGATGGRKSRRSSMWNDQGNLAELRERRGWSVAELANFFGVSKSSIDRGRRLLRSQAE